MSRPLETWVRDLSEDSIRWYYDTQELIRLHAELHDEYGDSPNEAIIPGEQRLSTYLRSMGIEHRYTDELSKAAGTLVENPADPTIEEVICYAERSITLLRPASSLVQDMEGGSIYFKMEPGILSTSLAKSILKMLNRWMPPGLKVKAMPKASQGEFARVVPLHSLELVPTYGPRQVTVWSSLTQELRDSAAQASSVFKRDTDPMVPFTIVDVRKKTTEAEPARFVLGEVLVPNEPDKTKANPDGTPTEADADIYDDVEVEKACHWWAENSGQFAYMHAIHQDGRSLYGDEIVLLENFIQRNELTIGKRVVKAGTWMMGARINDDSIWEDVVEKRLTGWSIGARAMASFEEAA